MQSRVCSECSNSPEAFAPDKDESVATLIKDPPPGAPVRRENRVSTQLWLDNFATVEPSYRGLEFQGAADARVAVIDRGVLGADGTTAIWAAIPGLNGLRHPVRAYLLLDLGLAIVTGIGVARLGRVQRPRLALVLVAVPIGLYALSAVTATLLPSVFDAQVVPAMAKAVSAAARADGVARRTDREAAPGPAGRTIAG